MTYTCWLSDLANQLHLTFSFLRSVALRSLPTVSWILRGSTGAMAPTRHRNHSNSAKVNALLRLVVRSALSLKLNASVRSAAQEHQSVEAVLAHSARLTPRPSIIAPMVPDPNPRSLSNVSLARSAARTRTAMPTVATQPANVLAMLLLAQSNTQPSAILSPTVFTSALPAELLSLSRHALMPNRVFQSSMAPSVPTRTANVPMMATSVAADSRTLAVSLPRPSTVARRDRIPSLPRTVRPAPARLLHPTRPVPSLVMTNASTNAHVSLKEM